MENDNSILLSIKKVVNVAPDDTSFDLDILLLINSAFATLHQLGVGTKTAFRISGNDEIWNSFISEDDRLNSVQEYIQLRVRTIFDPPSSSFVLDEMKERIKELEWRLNVVAETDDSESGEDDGL